MSVALLDVNALIALHWRPHIFHQAMMDWIVRNGSGGWATCSLTQAGFVRVLSNPSFDPNAPSPGNALALLKKSTESNPQHHFWTDTIPLTGISLSLRNRIQGHKQIPDAYLLAMSAHYRGTLVTFDSRMHSLAPMGSQEHAVLVVLRS